MEAPRRVVCESCGSASVVVESGDHNPASVNPSEDHLLCIKCGHRFSMESSQTDRE